MELKMWAAWIFILWVVAIVVVKIVIEIIQRRNRRCIFFSLNALIVALVRREISERDFPRALFLFEETLAYALDNTQGEVIEFRLVNDESLREEIRELIRECLPKAYREKRGYFGVKRLSSDFWYRLNDLLKKCGLVQVYPETQQRLGRGIRALSELLGERGLRVFAAGVY